MNGKNINIKNNMNFFSNFIHGIFGYHELPEDRSERIENIALKINELLKKKETLEIPEIMKLLDINVIDTLAAIQMLKQRGVVQDQEIN